MKTIEDLIKKLPDELKQEVVDFIEYLLQKRAPKSHRKLSQNWAGALKEYRQQYTSLELQKKSLEWRGD